MADTIKAAGETDLVAAHDKPQAPNGHVKTPGERSTAISNEGFRLLALNVERLLRDNVKRSIVVMSASPGEGRSTTAAGLANAMAQMTPPVVLIDADPDGTGLTHLVPERILGSSNGTAGSHSRLRVLNPWSSDLAPEPFFDKVQDIVHEALAAGATVIIDAPACSTSSVAFYLATTATGVLYVTRRGTGQDANVHADVGAQLELLGARVLGVVVNEG
jgi:Mrp family chromosome partitioning ATPase